MPRVTNAYDFMSISRTPKDMAVEEPKRPEYSSYVYMLAPTAFIANACDAKYREANDPETEIWRSCQRPSTATDVWDCFLADG
jgi:hypothetical protein